MAFYNRKKLAAGSLFTEEEEVWVQTGAAGVLNLAHGTAPSPSANTGKLYVKSADGVLYFKDAAGVETNLLATGAGDVVGPASSIDNEIALFSGTTGKIIKRATTTGVLKASSGVIASAVQGTDYYAPGGTDVAIADGGTGASDAATARTNLGLGALATKNTVATADIDNDAVTYAKMQNVSATDRVLGRSSVGAGDVEEIICTSFGRSLLDDADAAAGRTTLGLGTMATQNADAVAITGGTIVGLTGFAIRSSGAAFDLTFATDTVFTAGRTLTIRPGDASRILTISGNATISQDYSATGSPQFAALELGHATDTTITRVSAGVIAVEGVTVESVTGSQSKVDTHASATTGIHGVGASTVESASGSQAKVDTHAAATTGIHGVGGSTVESVSGSQAKVDTHAALTTTHGVSGDIVGTTSTQILTGKTLDDEIRAKQITTPSNPPAGYNKLYFKSDNKLYRLTSGGAEAEVGGSSLFDVQIFTITGSNTWTKPPGINHVFVRCIGAGGGGGSGIRWSSGNLCGGSGGGGGAINERYFRASELGATEQVIVGTGGIGGEGKTSGFGNNGGNGGSSQFGSFLIAGGGGGGIGGQDTAGVRGGGGASKANNGNVSGDIPTGGVPAASGTDGIAMQGTTPTVVATDGLNAEYGGASGGGGAQAAIGKKGGSSFYGGAGGGAGGGVNSAGVEYGGGAGGKSFSYAAGGGASGGAAGANGSNGTQPIVGFPGTGGGGGGGSTSAPGAGGAGSVGSGGGGGGALRAASGTSGAGGNGGRGEVIVISW